MSEHKTHPVFKVIGIGLITLFLVMLFSEKKEPEIAAESVASQVVSSPPVPPAPQAPRMKPETVVMFPDSSIACLSKEGLMAVSAHFIKGEKTKAMAYFVSQKNANGECLMLDPKGKFKVLSVEYNSTDLPDLGIMEIVGTSSASADGAWVFTAGAVAQP